MAPFATSVVFHVPHDATVIPDAVKWQFALDTAELRTEVIKMTDHLTLDLFTAGVPACQIVRATVSRLVVDVERFADDSLEPMSASGMGVVYQQTSDGKPLRHPITVGDRQVLIDTYYKPHHARLSATTQQILEQSGGVLLIDAHSFSSTPLPCETDQQMPRPDICIGTDDFHTPKFLSDAFIAAFEAAGFDVRLNSPFSGAMVPMFHYRKESRLNAVMIEVNRKLYLNEATGLANENFSVVADAIRRCTLRAVS